MARAATADDARPTAERLVATARTLFATNGYAETSLDDVVAACGVTKGSLYHHFAGKKELFEAVFEDECRRVCDQVAAVVAARREAWSAAYAGIGAFLDAARDPAVQRIMLLDAASVLGWERIREIDAKYGLALVRAAVEQLVAAREVARHDVTVMSHLLLGALSEAAMVVARADDQARARRTVERELRALIDGLRIASRKRG